MVEGEIQRRGLGPWLPNMLTALRLCTVPLLVWLILQERFDWALAVALIAGLSDAADGYLAKRFAWHSRIGGVLDPLADKLLMVATFASLAVVGWLPWWLVALTLLRDAVIVIGGTIYHFCFAPLTAQPTRLSKLNTVAQVVLAAVVLLQACCIGLHVLARDWLVWTVATLTTVTLVQYVWIWGWRARAVRVAERGHVK